MKRDKKKTQMLSLKVKEEEKKGCPQIPISIEEKRLPLGES